MLRWLAFLATTLSLCLCIPPQFSPGGPSLPALGAALLAMLAGAYFGTNTPHRSPAAVYGGMSGAAIAIALFELGPGTSWAGMASILVIVICALGGAALCSALASLRIAILFEPPRDVRKCDACGYDLRGLTEPRCPECRRHFSDERMLRVRAAGTDTLE